MSERNKVSNTGALTARVIGARVVDHGGHDGPTALGDVGDSPHLLFTGGRETDWPAPSTLVVLDATWAQVRRMRARVPGLQAMPTLSLPASPGRPRMRKEHLPEGVSTLEAVADALERLGDPEPAEALRALYDRMARIWLDLRQQDGRGR